MPEKPPKKGFWHRHMDKIGVAGSIIAVACCLGVPWVVAIFFGLGLGFIINDAILIPVLIVFLVVTLAGLYLGMRGHRRPWALVLGVVSAAAILFFLIVVFYRPMIWIGLAGVVAAIILNAWFKHCQVRN